MDPADAAQAPTAAPTAAKAFECTEDKDAAAVVETATLSLKEGGELVYEAEESDAGAAKAYCEEQCKAYAIAGSECTGYAYVAVDGEESRPA